MSKGNRNRKHRQENPPSYLLNSTQRRLLEEKVKESVLQQTNVMSLEMEAAWVWLLRNELELSVEECHRLYKQIEANHAELRGFYEVNPLDGMGWLYVQKCKDAGMDIVKWSKEPLE